MSGDDDGRQYILYPTTDVRDDWTYEKHLLLDTDADTLGKKVDISIKFRTIYTLFQVKWLTEISMETVMKTLLFPATAQDNFIYTPMLLNWEKTHIRILSSIICFIDYTISMKVMHAYSKINHLIFIRNWPWKSVCAVCYSKNSSVQNFWIWRFKENFSVQWSFFIWQSSRLIQAQEIPSKVLQYRYF